MSPPQETCWPLLPSAGYMRVGDTLSKTISVWLHGQCPGWAEKTNEGNKTLKAIETWEVVSYFSTKLGYWANGAFRIIPLKLVNFKAEYDYSKAKMRNVDVGLNYIILVMAKFFELLNNCFIGDMGELSIAIVSKQHAVFLTYIGNFETFAMAPKASPFS